MPTSNQRGVLVLSVDLPAELDGSATAAASLRPLLQLFEQCRVPATWASTDPAASLVVPHLAAYSAGHEVALLLDGAGEGNAIPVNTRSEMAGKLARAKAHGLTVGTLALTRPGTPFLMRTAQEHGIRQVRNGAGPTTNKRQGLVQWVQRLIPLSSVAVRMSLPRKIACGLVDVPAAMRWSTLRDLAGVRAAVLQTASAGGVLHVVIGGEVLHNAVRGNVRAYTQLFSKVAEHQACETLSVMTLAEAAAQLGRGSVGTPARSILRRAG